MNNTTRAQPVEDTKNAVYVRCAINGHSRLGLVDTGSAECLVPLSIVQGLTLQPTQRMLLAANTTEIKVLGELSIPVKMSRHCHLETRFLVSDQIADTMFGMDWLRQHRCRISFGTGAMFVGRRRFQFVKGYGGLWCRRITVAKETTLPNIWTMVAGQAIPEAHPTLVLQDNQTRLRFGDLRGETALLATDDVSGTLHHVEAETVGERDGASRHAFLTDELMACISEGDPPETRVRLERCAESRQHGNANALSQKSCLQCGQERPGPCRQRPQKATSNVTETGNGGSLVVEQIWDPVLCTE